MRFPETRWLWIPAALLLAACQPRPAREAPLAGSEAWPAFDYEAAARSGQAVYLLDADNSRVDIVVRRAGALARLGHDHAIQADALEGWALWTGERRQARAELRLPVTGLRVDSPEARSRHGLDTRPGEFAVEGTRRNLQAKVLQSGTWPHVLVTASELRREETDWSALVGFTVRGVTTTRRLPLRWECDPERMTVSGSLVITHAELGLEPFTALGGALKVADPIGLYFDIVMVRWLTTG